MVTQIYRLDRSSDDQPFKLFEILSYLVSVGAYLLLCTLLVACADDRYKLLDTEGKVAVATITRKNCMNKGEMHYEFTVDGRIYAGMPEVFTIDCVTPIGQSIHVYYLPEDPLVNSNVLGSYEKRQSKMWFLWPLAVVVFVFLSRLLAGLFESSRKS